MTNKKLYNIKETGALLGIGKNKVYDLIRHGYLAAMDLGGLKIPEAAIDSFIYSYSGYSFKDLSNIRRLESTSKIEVCNA